MFYNAYEFVHGFLTQFVIPNTFLKSIRPYYNAFSFSKTSLIESSILRIA